MTGRTIAAAAALILLLAACTLEGPETGKAVSNGEMAAFIADELASESFSEDLSAAIGGRRGTLTAVRTEGGNGRICYRLRLTGYGRIALDGTIGLCLTGSGPEGSMEIAIYEMEGTVRAGEVLYQIDSFAGTVSENDGGIRLSYPLMAGISSDGGSEFTIAPEPLPAETEQEAVKAISEVFAAFSSIPSEPETCTSGDITAVLSGDGTGWSMEASCDGLSLTAASGSSLAVIREDGKAWIVELQQILEGITIPPHISTLTLGKAYEMLNDLLQGNLLNAAAGLLNGRQSGVISLISSEASESGLRALFMLDGYPAADGAKAYGRLEVVFEGYEEGGKFVSERYTMDARELQIGSLTLTLSGIGGNLAARDGSRASLSVGPDGTELSRGAVFGAPERGRLGCGSWEMEL